MAGTSPTSTKLHPREHYLLTHIVDAYKDRGALTACDGRDRKPAWALEEKGLLRWAGTNWGSSFFYPTEAGLAYPE